MRQIQVPFIADFEEVDLDTALELEGARFQVDQVNWPAAFPYAPLCAGRIARTEDALVVEPAALSPPAPSGSRPGSPTGRVTRSISA